MILSKLLSAIIGLILCLPICTAVAFCISAAYARLTKITGMEGAAAMAILHLTLVITPILVLACAITHFIIAKDGLPGRWFAVEGILLPPSLVILWRLITG